MNLQKYTYPIKEYSSQRIYVHSISIKNQCIRCIINITINTTIYVYILHTYNYYITW